MQTIYLPFLYIRWHYSEAFADLYRNWQNSLIFILHIFSLKLLFKTWFSPLGRLNEDYKKSFDLEAFLETLVVNTMMRLVGFVMRTFVIISGLLALVVVFLLGLSAFILWTLAPLIIVSLFIQGISLLV